MKINFLENSLQNIVKIQTELTEWFFINSQNDGKYLHGYEFRIYRAIKRFAKEFCENYEKYEEEKISKIEEFQKTWEKKRDAWLEALKNAREAPCDKALEELAKEEQKKALDVWDTLELAMRSTWNK